MTSTDFAYTGAVQTWTVPSGVTSVVIETWGGASTSSVRGGYRRVLQTTTPGETLRVYVGQAAGGSGFNGGGTGSVAGAGGTDVRRGGTALSNRVCIAGGAGAGSNGGQGGASTGADGQGTGFSSSNSAEGGRGGTQTTGGIGGGFRIPDGSGGTGTAGVTGSLGTGGSSAANGGGGGLYGGGGGGSNSLLPPGGGGGGSNGGGSGSAVQADQRGVASPDGSLNGYARFTYAAAIIASADTLNTPPRVNLSLIGMGGTTATIVRVDAAGNRSFVRSANPAPISGGTWVGYDYEAPFNKPVTYMVVGSGETTINPTVVAVSTPWLIHPGVPNLSRPVLVESRGDRTRTVNVGVHRILGRKDPIVITDGARGSQTYDLTLRTDSATDSTALGALLDDASVLLLQISYPGMARTLYEWVSVGDVTVTELVAWFGSERERWTLPLTVTVAPSGLLQAQFGWADVAATYTSWADVTAAFPTWNDLILNRPTT